MGLNKEKREEEIPDAEVGSESAPVPSKKCKLRVRIADNLPESPAGVSSSALYERNKVQRLRRPCLLSLMFCWGCFQVAVAEVDCETQGARKRKRLRKNKQWVWILSVIIPPFFGFSAPDLFSKGRLESFKKAKLNVIEPEVGTKTFSDFAIDDRILKVYLLRSQFISCELGLEEAM